MKFWFTSDYHLGHNNIIKYCDRPFRDLEHMNDTIIRNHNSRVHPEDTVFHIGDFCFKNTVNGKEGEGVPIYASEWESKLNGKIIHVKGNHDKNNSTKTIIKGILIEHCGVEAYLVHKPIHYNDRYKLNLTGHVHEKWKIKDMGNGVVCYNVGVDVNRFMPVTLDEIKKQLNKWKNIPF